MQARALVMAWSMAASALVGALSCSQRTATVSPPADADGHGGDAAAGDGGDAELPCDGQGYNACGNCSTACSAEPRGGDGASPLPPPAVDSGLAQNPDGSITLAQNTSSTTDFAWPSNDVEGTVSCVDTLLRREVGRYATVLEIAGADPARPGVVPNYDDWDSGCNSPSRTTVDGDGNAYVANRAHGCNQHQGTVTKVALYDPAACELSLALCQCVDRDGDGRIQTSRDCNGYGLGEDGLCPDAAVGEGHAREPDGIELDNEREFLAYDDECLLWTVPIGAGDSRPRAMAIDADGFVWVGDYNNLKFYKLRASDGAAVSPSPSGTPSAAEGVSVKGRPYGAVIDGTGTLWYSNDYDVEEAGKLQSIDTLTGVVSPADDLLLKNHGGYGITVDRKNRVWMALAYERESGGGVLRYDPAAQTTDVFGAGLTGDWLGRGITATASDEGGVIWAAFHPTSSSGGTLVGFDDETGDVFDTVDLVPDCGASTAIGVGIGAGGSVLVVNQGSDNVCSYDPNTHTVRQVKIGRGPYTYSDFTGNIFRSFTRPSGRLTVVDACPEGKLPTWVRVDWVAETPGTSYVEVTARTAASIEALPLGQALGPVVQQPTTSLELSGFAVHERFLQVELSLVADRDGRAPTLRSYTIVRMCAEPPA